MNELLKVNLNENQEPIISGRELHEVLEVNSNYTTWFNRMCEYGFVENVDYISFWSNSKNGNAVEYLGSPQKMSAKGYELNHALKLDMAKEIAMLQRNEKGKQVRQYFIEVEKEYNSPEKIMARALNIANKQLETLTLVNKQQEQQIKELQPKALFAESVEASKTSILIGELAKILKQNGVDTGQNKLFERLREEGYLMKGGSSRNLPTQKAMELGLFEIKESVHNNPDGSIRVNKTTKVTGKGQIYFINKYCKSVA